MGVIFNAICFRMLVVDVMFDALIEFVELKLDLCRTGNTTNTFRSIPKNTYCGRILIAIKIVQKTEQALMQPWSKVREPSEF